MSRSTLSGVVLASFLGAGAMGAPAAARTLEEAAAFSEQAASSESVEQVRDLSNRAIEGSDGVSGPVRVPARGSPGKEAPKAYPQAPLSVRAALVPPPSGRSIAEERRELQRRRAPGKFLRAAAYGTLGFLGGVIAGWAIGGAAGGAFVMKAPNPKIRKWRWALVLPAVIIGAAVGGLAIPFVLGYVFSKAEPYPTKGLPSGKK